MLASIKLLDEGGATAYLQARWGVKRSVRTLQKYRCIGGGPRFRRIGANRVGYEEPALDEYAQAIISPPANSTSDPVLTRLAEPA
jgi:hypothetical protein